MEGNFKKQRKKENEYKIVGQAKKNRRFNLLCTKRNAVSGGSIILQKKETEEGGVFH